MSAYLIGFVCGWCALAVSTLIGRSSRDMPPPSHLYDWGQHDDLS